MPEGIAKDVTPLEKLIHVLVLVAKKRSARSFTIVAKKRDNAPSGYETEVWMEADGAWAREMEPPYDLHRPMVDVLTRYADVEPVARGEREGRFTMNLGRGELHDYALKVRFAEPEPPFVIVTVLGPRDPGPHDPGDPGQR